MELAKHFFVLFAIISICNALSCAPQEPLTLRQQFYKSWAEDKPFSEFHVLETFEEVEYMDPVSKQPSPNDMVTIIAFVQVHKVYTGCAAQTPYYAYFKDTYIRYASSGIAALQKGNTYIAPMSDIAKLGKNEAQTIPACSGFVQNINSLLKEESDFLQGRMSCCNGSCTCIGNGRTISQCGTNQCMQAPPCPSAINCRVNPCNYCAEEWFADNWQVPC